MLLDTCDCINQCKSAVGQVMKMPYGVVDMINAKEQPVSHSDEASCSTMAASIV